MMLLHYLAEIKDFYPEESSKGGIKEIGKRQKLPLASVIATPRHFVGRGGGKGGNEGETKVEWSEKVKGEIKKSSRVWALLLLFFASLLHHLLFYTRLLLSDSSGGFK